ncbi:MAG: metal ABC transporter permease [Deltaproteobacteria bacterium]|nr:metal ABC transporter permease [Deltaproteobacteria bacterium]
MFEFAFMQRALAAAVLVGLLCGVLGFFVVLRRLAFIGVGISHSAIGGVAIGILAGWSPLLTGAVFAVAVALGIALVSQSDHISEDTVIGVFFSGSMALGIVLFSMKSGYQQDLFSYLFGNVLAISTAELVALACASAVILAVVVLSFKEHLLIAFDEEVAAAYGHKVVVLNVLLLVVLALTVVIGVRLVGLLLIQALLVVPAAIAALWAANFRWQVVLAAGVGSLSGILGLVLAYHFDLAAGGSIVIVAVALFFITLLARLLVKQR